MLIVKMMTPDKMGKTDQVLSDDPMATFSLFSGIRSVSFERPPGAERPIITLTDEHYINTTYGVFSDVFVMNEHGKTVQSFRP